MTLKEVKAFLERYRRIDGDISEKQEQAARIRSKAAYISPTFDNISSAPQSRDKAAETLIKLEALEKEINEDIDRLVDIQREIRNVIASVPEEKLRLLLEKRYFGGKSFEKIAVEMNYSYPQILRLHEKALNKVKMILNDI